MLGLNKTSSLTRQCCTVGVGALKEVGSPIIEFECNLPRWLTIGKNPQLGDALLVTKKFKKNKNKNVRQGMVPS
jgi:hypothetical protein